MVKQMPKAPAPTWDQFAIKAEIRRRGKTLEALAKEAGVSGSFMRRAFRVPSTRTNNVIAQFLNVPTHVLWPDWFDLDGDLIPARYRRKLSRQRLAKASQESRAA